MSLRRFVPPPPSKPQEVCGFCSVPVGPQHGHVVNLETRALMCACRGCWLLFTNTGAAGRRFRSVPERYAWADTPVLTAAQWDELGVPVEIAFFFFNSRMGGAVALYPSPAGATESQLPPGLWEDVARGNPLVADLAADVEALLVRSRPEGLEAYLVPIDACYELVGRIRRHWRGFDGGGEARREIDGFFERVRAKSEPWRAVCTT